MYLRKDITRQADSYHYLDLFQMICISFEVQPKGLISAEAKKLFYQTIFNSLNDTQYYNIRISQI